MREGYRLSEQTTCREFFLHFQRWVREVRSKRSGQLYEDENGLRRSALVCLVLCVGCSSICSGSGGIARRRLPSTRPSIALSYCRTALKAVPTPPPLRIVALSGSGAPRSAVDPRPSRVAAPLPTFKQTSSAIVSRVPAIVA